MTLQGEWFARFNTTPFCLQVLVLPEDIMDYQTGWLIEHILLEKVKDPFAYRFYENKASETGIYRKKLPLVASYIEKDLMMLGLIMKKEYVRIQKKYTVQFPLGLLLLKAEISEYIASLSTVNPVYADEVENFRNIAKDNLSGVITTNYDCFSRIFLMVIKLLWDQDELVFLQLQGNCGVYKISWFCTKSRIHCH